MISARCFVRVYNGLPHKGGEFAGTAFLIGSQQLLTAAHVVDACANGIFLQGMPGGSTEAIPSQKVEYGKTDQGERDFAVLHTGNSYSNSTIPLAIDPPKTGDKVKLYGFFDETQELHPRDSIIGGHVGTSHSWQIATGVKKGMSGGAVVRDDELIGLIYARDEADKLISYCIPIDEIHQSLGAAFDSDLTDTPFHHGESERAIEVFVGRNSELDQLQDLLLRDNKAPVAVTALHGMAGVGKSWLVDHFYATHQGDFPGGYQRLTLDAENPSSPELLIAELAERLELSFPPNQLLKHLVNRLNSTRTLIHIENVDADRAALVTTQLCKQLTHCSIVISGRLENFGKAQRWKQISLKPFDKNEALKQLESELQWLECKPPPTEEALKLVDTLGGLPLAIHIASGYLAQGFSTAEFIDELHLTDYDLQPADPSDDLLSRDQARAVLHSASFSVRQNYLRIFKKMHCTEWIGNKRSTYY